MNSVCVLELPAALQIRRVLPQLTIFKTIHIQVGVVPGAGRLRPAATNTSSVPSNVIAGVLLGPALAPYAG